MTTLIEETIRKHYQAENGEWIIEKGRMKEAKLLKAAVEVLERRATFIRDLQSRLEKAEKQNLTESLKLWKREQDLDMREREIEKREARFEERKAAFIRDFEKWV